MINSLSKTKKIIRSTVMLPYILAAIAIVIIVPTVIVLIYLSRLAKANFEEQFKRTSPEKWARECSCPENEEHLRMFNLGLDWGRSHTDNMSPLSITSFDGLKLVGEYFDFGKDKAVIILPGRAESLYYGYYFAEPFEKAGYNVFIPDVRAHGNSEGTYGCLGLKEYRDVLDWAKLLHEQHGVKKIVLYGLCIGGATSVYAVTDEKTPDYIKAIITEGVYTSFYEVLLQRTRNKGKPTFPVVPMMYAYTKKYCGVDIKKKTPLECIKRVKVPALFLCGKEDVSSLPEKCQLIFDECSSEHKKLIWYDKGAHSHLRINNVEEYDRDVTAFLNEYVD